MAKKERVGIVVSEKTNKTRIVLVQTKYQHPKYKKILIHSKRYMAHDELNQSHPGDLVLLQESRPLSKWKHWVLKEIFPRLNHEIKNSSSL
jgi:small subunit ribosomal protein S17